MSSIPDDPNAILARIDDQCYTDAEILATARDLIPALAGEVRRLREENAELDAESHRIYASRAKMRTKWGERSDEVIALRREVRNLTEELMAHRAVIREQDAERAALAARVAGLEEEVTAERAELAQARIARPCDWCSDTLGLPARGQG
jgi:chromosome segregation ATPase